MSGTGTGVAAATAVTVQAASPQTHTPTPVFQCASSGCVSAPVFLGADRAVYVSFYGTGIRGGSSRVSVTVGGVDAPVQFAGPTSEFAGLDQVNVLLPAVLRGRGESNVVLTVDGETSNAVTINVR
jgi:uncharacterized protein (TIGR03437 family)